MLGKLLKHEFKSQYSMFAGIYIFIVILSLVYAASNKVSQLYPGNPIFKVIAPLALIAAVIGLVAMFIITVIMAILRYRNNLLKDEGYLMHTLPVSPLSLHVSKLITTAVWIIVDFAVLMLMVGVLTWDWKYSWINAAIATFSQAGLEVSGGMVVFFLIYMLLSVMVSISQFFVSLNLGHLSYGSKGLMSFVAYMITYAVSQVISVVGMLIFGAIEFGGDFNVVFEQTSGGPAFIGGIFITSSILMLLLFAGYNVISVYALKKKLNLE